MAKDSIKLNINHLEEKLVENQMELKELAKRAGCSYEYLRKFKVGETEYISPRRLKSIASVLNVSPQYLCADILSNSDLQTDKRYREQACLLDRFFYDNSLLRNSDILFFSKIMGYLQFDEEFTNTIIEKIKKEHESKQIEISMLINQIFDEQSIKRKSDLIFLRDFLSGLEAYYRESEYCTEIDNKAKSDISQEIQKRLKEIGAKLDQISEDSELEQNHQKSIHIPAIIKPSFIDLPGKVSQKVHEIQNEEQLHMIEIIVEHLDCLDQSHINIINGICKASESFSYKKHIQKTYPIQELLFDWIYTSLIPGFHREAYDLIWGKEFNITEAKEKEEYLKGIYSEQDFLLQNFTCILNETIDYHLPGKQTVKNSILHWVYKKLIPNFLIKTRKEIDSMDINIDEAKGKELLRKIKTQSSQLQDKFTDSLIEQIKHFF